MLQRTNKTIARQIERLVNFLTIIGFIGTASVVFRFLASTPYIRLANTGIWGITIQGVPFVWIVSSLTLLNMRNFYNAIKALTNSPSHQLTALLITAIGILSAYTALKIITAI